MLNVEGMIWNVIIFSHGVFIQMWKKNSWKFLYQRCWSFHVVVVSTSWDKEDHWGGVQGRIKFIYYWFILLLQVNVFFFSVSISPHIWDDLALIGWRWFDWKSILYSHRQTVIKWHAHILYFYPIVDECFFIFFLFFILVNDILMIKLPEGVFTTFFEKRAFHL